MKSINGYLSVVIPIDISFIKPHIDNINSVIGTSKYYCQQTDVNDNSECHNMFQPISARYKDIVYNFESISHLVSRRTKRSAWFGGIGTAFKHLFGTMDQDDAIRYNNAIQTVENDQKEIAKLMKDNILITTTTLNSYKDTINKISINEQTLNSAVENLSLGLKNLTIVYDKLAVRSTLNRLLNILENSLLTLSFKLEDIINAIMFSKSNILYPTIITPKQLFNELVENYRFLPSAKELPVTLELDNIHIITNISELISYYMDNKIVFVLKIPLVNPTEYNLYHNIPFPVAHNMENVNSYATIIPSTKYIAIAKDKAFYCKLDNINSCKIIMNKFYVCQTTNIFSSLTATICETEIITKSLSSIPEQCETRFLKGNIESWQPLNNNKWIFVISKVSKISIQCQLSDGFETDIVGTGILNLPPNCIAYCKNTQLIPKYSIKIEIQPIITNFDLINNTCCNFKKFKELNLVISNTTLKHVNLESLMYDKEKYSVETAKNLDNIINKPHMILYGEYYSYTTIVITIVIISFILYKLCKSNTCLLILNNLSLKKQTIPNPSNPEICNEPQDDISLQSIPAPRIRTSLT